MRAPYVRHRPHRRETAEGRRWRRRPDRKAAGEKIAKGEKLALSGSSVILVSGDSGVRTGTAALKGVTVQAKVLGTVRTRKVLVFKKKRTKQYRRTKGHRQTMIEVRIDAIEG